ncbi:MAG: DUF2490 domain-containing protein [Flavitalea sp.]
MLHRTLILLFMAMNICVHGFSQKHTTDVQQVWMGFFNQTRFSDKWGISAEVQLRTKEDFFTNFSQFFLRGGITYYASDKTKLTAGYAYISLYPGDGHPGITQPEHRPWQQVQWHTSYSKARFMQWLRIEERYRRKIKDADELGDGYNFNWRFRYNFQAMLPLSKKPYAKNTLTFVASDEVIINAGREIVYNYFDQNRFFVGFAYHVNKSDYLQFGYLNVFQQLAAGNHYKMIHVPRVYFFQNLDLRRKS